MSRWICVFLMLLSKRRPRLDSNLPRLGEGAAFGRGSDGNL